MNHTIERLGHRGDGIAPGPVFAAMTLPGEIVTGDVVGDRIPDPKIVTPSPDRVRPPCSHFRACGACALQHASDEFVAEWKADIVRRALAAHGLDAPIRRVHTSPPASRRRAALSGRRTKKGAMVGFHARASDTIIEIPNCTLLHPDLIAALPALSDLTVMAASRKSGVTIYLTATETGLDVAVQGARGMDAQLLQDLPRFAISQNWARLTWDGDLVAGRAPPMVRTDGIAITPPPGAFLQATEAGQAALLNAVVEATTGAKQVVDLFAGCGTFALPLARVAEVHAVENDAEMLASLDAAWRQATGLKRVTTETRDLFARPLVPLDLKRFDAAVIDPPRAGAAAQIAEICESAIGTVAAVSCNPVSFAQDAAALAAAGFRMDWIDVMDQFRWSPHVELAAAFRR